MLIAAVICFALTFVAGIAACVAVANDHDVAFCLLAIAGVFLWVLGNQFYPAGRYAEIFGTQTLFN